MESVCKRVYSFVVYVCVCACVCARDRHFPWFINQPMESTSHPGTAAIKRLPSSAAHPYSFQRPAGWLQNPSSLQAPWHPGPEGFPALTAVTDQEPAWPGNLVTVATLSDGLVQCHVLCWRRDGGISFVGLVALRNSLSRAMLVHTQRAHTAWCYHCYGIL